MTEKSSEKDYCLLVFTDLDGTLLDHETYSFKAALPAVNALKEKNIPLIFCTSKTRAEIEKVRSELQNTHPFIPENGGAIFMPRGYFSDKFRFTKEDAHYFIIELGTSYSKLREVLRRMGSLFPGKLKGFGDMTSKEVAHLCGFSLDEAKLAKEREYDEPFILLDEAAEGEVRQTARQFNLQVSRGGRFYHLIGANDKGKAVLKLRDIYGKKAKNLKTIALGDSLNDLPMLQAVDYPVLVQKPDQSYDPSVRLDNLTLASGSGPAGWGEALLTLIEKLM